MKDTDFDRLIRSAMENAEEEVPARVWSSVSSRIAQKRVVTLNWKRVAAAAAVAAVIVCGVFISGTLTINQTNTDSDLVAADRSGNTVAAEPSPFGVVAPSGDVLLADVAESIRSASPQSLPVTEEAAEVAEIVPSAEGRDAVSESTAEDGSARVSRSEVIPEEGPASIDDPFAQMACEDRPSRRGISVKMGGDVATNSNASSLGYSVLSRRGSNNRSITQLSKESTYAVPVSLGIGVRIPISGRWSLETGLTYSFLERTFTGVYKEFEGGLTVNTINAEIRNSLHYAGVPLMFSYDILSSRRTMFYAYAGGALEKAFLNRYSIPASSAPIIYTESVNGVQVSAAAGIGVNFLLNDWLGFYIDPSVRYYFDCGQPVSIRTQQQFMMNLEMGFRFNLGR